MTLRQPAILALLALLLVPGVASARQDLDERLSLDRFDLQGPVKTFRSRTIIANMPWSPSNEEEVYYFDHAGTVSKVEILIRENLDTVRTYQFDASGQHVVIISVSNQSVDPEILDMSEVHREQVRLDADGHVIGCDFYLRNEPVGTLSRRYDSKGRLIEEVTESSEGELLFKRVADYDDEGGLVDEVVFGLATRPVVEPATPDESATCEYDSAGRRIHCVKENWEHRGFQLTTNYTYDDAGRLVLESTGSSSGSSEKTEYTYDAHGSLIRKAYSNSKRIKTLDEWTYRYDAHGNWIWQRWVQTMDIPNSTMPAREEITTRTIEYYS